MYECLYSRYIYLNNSIVGLFGTSGFFSLLFALSFSSFFFVAC